MKDGDPAGDGKVCRMQHYESNACDRREWNGVWAARHAGGLTLLEVMIAIAVVVTAATAILCGLSAAYANERVSSEQIAAQNLARRMQEELMGVPFDDLIPNYDATSVTSGGLRALLNVNQAQPASGAPTLLRIQVRVRRLGEANDILSLVTLRSDRRAPRSAWLSSP
ncbi:MAG: hypothetical protein BWX69_03075 [Planctomycetes bacterium ADurb.Bin069]|nr:MAG: hypothetical protein BWX69_03075 [Planctomycetes bacterium ADurb.Bin069]